jgi:hypothetical protein
MQIRRIAPAACVVLLLAGCSRDEAASSVAAPGPGPSAKQQALQNGAAMLQEIAPLEAFDVYVDGFHFVNGDLGVQVEAHHYCSKLSADVRQCVIFDGNGREARLLGIEYIISRRIFEQLAPAERRLWHSHVYDVKSGSLVAPGVPEVAEREVMAAMVDTYGKTWHTWHAGDQRTTLPLGHPLLMAGFTADDQIDPRLLAARDERLKVPSSARRKDRHDLPAPLVAEGADAWQRGEALQIGLQPVRSAPRSDNQAEPNRDGTVIFPPRRNRTNRSTAVYAGLEPAGHE